MAEVVVTANLLIQSAGSDTANADKIRYARLPTLDASTVNVSKGRRLAGRYAAQWPFQFSTGHRPHVGSRGRSGSNWDDRRQLSAAIPITGDPFHSPDNLRINRDPAHCVAPTAVRYEAPFSI